MSIERKKEIAIIVIITSIIIIVVVVDDDVVVFIAMATATKPIVITTVLTTLLEGDLARDGAALRKIWTRMSKLSVRSPAPRQWRWICMTGLPRRASRPLRNGPALSWRRPLTSGFAAMERRLSG